MTEIHEIAPPERLAAADRTRNERAKKEAENDNRRQTQNKQQKLHKEMGKLLDGSQHMKDFHSLAGKHCWAEKDSLKTAESLADRVDEVARATAKIEKTSRKGSSDRKFRTWSEKANEAIELIASNTERLASEIGSMLSSNDDIVKFLGKHSNVATLYAYYENHFATNSLYSEATTRKELEPITASMVDLARQRQAECAPVLEDLQSHASRIHEAAQQHIDGGPVAAEHISYMVDVCQMIERETRELLKKTVEALISEENPISLEYDHLWLHRCSLHPLNNPHYVEQLCRLSQYYIHDHRWGDTWGP